MERAFKIKHCLARHLAALALLCGSYGFAQVAYADLPLKSGELAPSAELELDILPTLKGHMARLGSLMNVLFRDVDDPDQQDKVKKAIDEMEVILERVGNRFTPKGIALVANKDQQTAAIAGYQDCLAQTLASLDVMTTQLEATKYGEARQTLFKLDGLRRDCHSKYAGEYIVSDDAFAPTIGAALLDGFPRHLRYARASEASTLFIHDVFADAPPYLRIKEQGEGVYVAEDFDGETKRFFHIAGVEKTPADLILEMIPTGSESGGKRVYTIYPYRDIDHTFVVIQTISNEEERPVKWAIPAQFGDRIELMPEGFP